MTCFFPCAAGDTSDSGVSAIAQEQSMDSASSKENNRFIMIRSFPFISFNNRDQTAFSP